MSIELTTNRGDVKADSHVAVYRQGYYIRSMVLSLQKHIFLVNILILRHVLFRLIQKYLSPVINCLLCYMNWYSCCVIRSSHRIFTLSHRIRMAVKFYNDTLWLRYECIRCAIFLCRCLSNENIHKRLMLANK